jgi:predicted DNA-binding transcriptional regulator YafY
MPKREYILRYTSIIKRLRKSEATFEEISDYLQRESEFQGYEFTVSKRTFQRDLDDIRSLYEIDIQYNFSRKVYHIAEDNREEENNRMLEAFDLFNTLNKSEGFSDYIHFEKRKPQGTEHFYGLLHAIKNRFALQLTHHKFWEDKPTLRTVKPLGLKEFKGRWYLLAMDEKDSKIKTFGLDRILDFTITKQRFEKISAKEISSLFDNSFGIINPDNTKPEKIVLSFSSEEGKYIKTYPLHSSQKIISENEGETRIELYLHITYDFVMELLSYGSELEVIKPDSLRKEMCKTYSEALKQYK